MSFPPNNRRFEFREFRGGIFFPDTRLFECPRFETSSDIGIREPEGVVQQIMTRSKPGQMMIGNSTLLCDLRLISGLAIVCHTRIAPVASD